MIKSNTCSVVKLFKKEVLKVRFVGKPVEILLVEDNKDDVGLIEKVFEEAKIRNKLHVAEDGEEAISIYVVKENSQVHHAQT